jgi:glycerol-3-phosphate dehydrogenase
METLETMETYRTRIETELPPSADVVIIGGGIIGAATAFFAARADCAR